MRWIARIVGLVLLMGSAGPASASEAPPDAPTVQVEGKPLLPPLEAPAFRKTRTPFWIGLGLVLGGAPVLAVGYFGAIISCGYGCDGYPAVVWVLLGTSAGASVVGQFLMVSSAFSNTRRTARSRTRAWPSPRSATSRRWCCPARSWGSTAASR